MEDWETEPLATSNDELQHTVRELTEEARVVREAVDELREVIDYLVRQIPPDFWELMRARRITSMPVDPTDPDFGEKLNAVSSEDIPHQAITREKVRPAQTRPTANQRLLPDFGIEEDDEPRAIW